MNMYPARLHRFPILPLLTRIFQDAQVDATHGLEHAFKIAHHTDQAIAEEQICPDLQEDVVLAALLHDVDDKKYFPFNRNLDNATRILGSCELTEERIKRILIMIDLVSFSKHGNSIDLSLPILYYYPRFIDRTEAIGMKGLLRSLEYNERIRMPVYLESTPRPSSREELLEIMEGRSEEYVKSGGRSASLVDHIFDKLLHIELPGCLRNSYIRSMYESEVSTMESFVLREAQTGYVHYKQNLKISTKGF